MTFIPSAFGASFVFAHASTVTNDISVEANAGNNGVDGADGTAGADGAAGMDGAHGANRVDGASGIPSNSEGNAQAGVTIVNNIDGNEIATSTIVVQTSSPTGAIIKQQQTITTDHVNTIVQNIVKVTPSKNAPDDLADSGPLVAANNSANGSSFGVNADGTEPQDTGFFAGVLTAVWNGVESFFNALSNLFLT